MAYIKNCSSFLLCNLAHFIQTFFLKIHISNCKDFIHNQYFRIQMCSHGKGISRLETKSVLFGL